MILFSALRCVCVCGVKVSVWRLGFVKCLGLWDLELDLSA